LLTALQPEPLAPQFADVSALLAPKSIAIIGASDTPGAVSGVSIRLLQKFSYPGPVWPVNPRRKEVHGLPCFASVADLPAPSRPASR
jgi:acetate---CoA ligase (ADP-forming)